MSTLGKDTLRMLAIFHYVTAGLIAFFACIPLMHLTMGISMTMARGGDASSWIIGGVVFVVIACLAILTGWAAAFLVFSAGTNLDRQTNYQFCTVGACVVCLFVPLGTILGIFKLISLHEDSVKALFNRNKIETSNELPMDSRP